MGRTISLTEAKAKLNELVRDAQDDNVVLVRHGQPAAVIVSPEHYEGLLEEIEDLKDRLSLHASEPGELNVPLSTLRSELVLPDVALARLADALGSSSLPSPDLTEWVAKLAPTFAALDIGPPASEVLAAITTAAAGSVLAFLRTVLTELSEGTSAQSA
ncbi:MAG TPA: type II toxin-antitoxin system Phd/YefM family antitoxin [Actinomycetota bacterium]